MRIINDNFIKSMKHEYFKNMKLDIKNMIGYSLGLTKGENYKMKETLRKIIEYKVKDKRGNDSDMFQLYVSTLENIIELIKSKYPFIDLTGITLEWTPEQISNHVMNTYLNMPVVKIEVDHNS